VNTAGCGGTIPATWEADAGGIQIGGQAGKVSKTLTQKQNENKGLDIELKWESMHEFNPTL
jgi:hypothetical protein